VKALDVCGLHILDLHLAQARQDVPFQNAAIVPDASGSFLWHRVFFDVAIGQF
jgi:hypothetical protein